MVLSLLFIVEMLVEMILNEGLPVHWSVSSPVGPSVHRSVCLYGHMSVSLSIYNLFFPSTQNDHISHYELIT